MLEVSLSLEGKGYLHFSDPSLLHRPDVFGGPVDVLVSPL